MEGTRRPDGSELRTCKAFAGRQHGQNDHCDFSLAHLSDDAVLVLKSRGFYRVNFQTGRSLACRHLQCGRRHPGSSHRGNHLVPRGFGRAGSQVVEGLFNLVLPESGGRSRGRHRRSRGHRGCPRGRSRRRNGRASSGSRAARIHTGRRGTRRRHDDEKRQDCHVLVADRKLADRKKTEGWLTTGRPQRFSRSHHLAILPCSPHPFRHPGTPRATTPPPAASPPACRPPSEPHQAFVLGSGAGEFPCGGINGEQLPALLIDENGGCFFHPWRSVRNLVRFTF
jgi:hypothetical protein